MEYIETARAAIEITSIKNADSRSTTNAKFRNVELDMEYVNFSPNRTENEKIIPKMDAIEALRNAE